MLLPTRTLSIILASLLFLGQCRDAHGRDTGLRAGRLTHRLRNKGRTDATDDNVHRRMADEENQFAEVLYQANPQYAMQEHQDAFDELLAYLFDNMSVPTNPPTVVPTAAARLDVPTPSTPAPSALAVDLVDIPSTPAPSALAVDLVDSPSTPAPSALAVDLADSPVAEDTTLLPTIPATFKPTEAPATSLTEPPTDSPTSMAPTVLPTELPTLVPTASPATTAPSSKPTLSPVLACGMSPQLRSEAIFAILASVSAPSLLMDPTTPQGRAFFWLVGEDGLYVCPDAEKIVQRYVLAVMYFSTNGDFWFQCSANPSAADDCGNEAPFLGEDRFLSPVHECEWAGIECNEKLCVSEIEFELNNLVGIIPDEIVQLTDLEVLGMERGGLSGTIPTVLGQLSKLYFLDLDYNALTGSIPTEISLLSELEQLDLNDNSLTGGIESVVTLKKLFFLQLHNNMFSGTVPEEIGEFPELGAFTIHTNDLTGEMPSQVCRLRDTFGGPLITLTADCNPPENPQINCTCCTDCRNV